MTHKILFAHIPKTGGTSMRAGLEAFFSGNKVIMDYGPKSETTSRLVRRWVYEADDRDRFKAEAGEWSVIIAHFHDTRPGLAGYRKLFPEARLATFVRDPIERILSEYDHFKVLYAFSGSLADFYAKDSFKNRQCRSLGWTPLIAFDFVGILEKYVDSVSLFNALFGAAIEHKRLNVRKGARDGMAPAREDIKRICQFNIEDIALYNQALITFYRQSRQSIPVECPGRYGHGALLAADGWVRGWAADYSTHRPANLRLQYQSGKIVHAPACIYRQEMVQNRKHLSGYCGFEFDAGHDENGKDDRLVKLHIAGGPEIQF